MVIRTFPAARKCFQSLGVTSSLTPACDKSSHWEQLQLLLRRSRSVHIPESFLPFRLYLKNQTAKYKQNKVRVSETLELVYVTLILRFIVDHLPNLFQNCFSFVIQTISCT